MRNVILVHAAVDPKYDLQSKPTEIVIKPSRFLEREIIGKYLLGYDIIRLETKDKIGGSIMERIKDTSSRLIGLEIIEENYSTVVMQCLLESSTFTPDKILRREHSIVSGMYRDSARALTQNDIHLAENIVFRDNEVDRLYFLLVRFLRRVIQNPRLSDKLDISPIDCLDYRLTAIFVELVGDISAELASFVIDRTDYNLNDNISDLILMLNENIYVCFQDALSAFLSRNMILAENVRNRRKSIDKISTDLLSLGNDETAQTAQDIQFLSSLTVRVYNHSVDISDLTVPLRN